jgi:hypothetical protein
MNRWETRISHLSTALVTASGVVYLWMKYFLVTDDPFAIVNHPWQPAMLSLHVLAAPVLTFVVGLIVSSHVRKKLAGGGRSNRRSGLIAVITFPTMVVSGYALQAFSNPTLTKAALILHLVSSAFFALGYVVHQIVSFALARRTRSIRQEAAVNNRVTA